jgi:hypothetical protein
MDDIWSDKGRWPRDSADYVFLANAVVAIGKERFGSEWSPRTARELTAPLRPFPESQRVEHFAARERADAALRAGEKRYRPTISQVSIGLPSLNTLRPAAARADFAITRNSWSRAENIIDERNAELLPAVGEFAQVRDWIVERATMGDLPTFLRAKKQPVGSQFQGIGGAS